MQFESQFNSIQFVDHFYERKVLLISTKKVKSVTYMYNVGINYTRNPRNQQDHIMGRSSSVQSCRLVDWFELYNIHL